MTLLEEQLRALMKILIEQIDRLMRQFFVEPDSPEKIARRNFYELYQAARVIVETPSAAGPAQANGPVGSAPAAGGAQP